MESRADRSRSSCHSALVASRVARSTIDTSTACDGLSAPDALPSATAARTASSIRRNRTALKGPITTPVGTGFRSVNVSLRQDLDLFAAVRPVASLPGIPSRFDGVNLKNPGWADVAKTLGAEGVVVKNLGDVGEALEKAIDAQKRGKTTVLEMLVTKELGDPFRRDALKKPKRLLKKYEHTNVA